jgi:hypothetical protein
MSRQSPRSSRGRLIFADYFSAVAAGRRPALRNAAPFVIFVSSCCIFGCTSKPAEPQPLVAVTRQVGSWSGRGSTTVGDVNSDTGRLRISWKTTNEEPAGGGRFRLTLRSGVSGRTIAVVADHKGVGSGTLETDEGPRTYDFLIDSANVDWSFRVEETTGEYGTGRGRSSPENQKF